MRSHERLEAAISLASERAEALLPPGALTTLVARVLGAAKRGAVDAGRPEFFPITVHLPLAIERASTGSEGRTLTVAAAGLLVHLGADLLDKVIDNEPLSHGLSEREAVLAGAGLLGVLPQLLALEVEAGPAARAGLAHELATAVAAMGAGQAAELAATGDGAPIPSVEDAIEAASLKSGALLAALARMAARLAGARPKAVEAYAEFAATIGVADQLRGDFLDLLRCEHSRDLAAGARTLPVCVYAETLPADRVGELRERLRLARFDPGVREALARELTAETVRAGCARVLQACYKTASITLAYSEERRAQVGELRRMAAGACALPGSEGRGSGG